MIYRFESREERDEKMNNSEVVSAFVKLMTNAEKQYMAAQNAMKTEDDLTQDYLHGLELCDFSLEESSKIMLDLQENRRDRRYYKDILEELEPLVSFLSDANNRKAMKALERALGDLRKTEKYHECRTYHPKVNRMEAREE